MMKKGLLGLSIGAVAILVLSLILLIQSRDFKEMVIGSYFYEELQKVRPLDCVRRGDSTFSKMKPCLDKMGHRYSILGDTSKGNFRITISKPYAEAFVEIINWNVSSGGAGVRSTFKSHTCFIHQYETVPTFTDTELEILKKYGSQWFKINPEALKRYITNAEETVSEVRISSAPLENMQNYDEYCPDSFQKRYLDDIQNPEWDLVKIKK